MRTARLSFTTLARRHGALLAGLVSLGCAGTLDDPDSDKWRPPQHGLDGGNECSAVVASLFERSCAARVCHAAEAEAALDLESPGLPARLSGMTGTGDCSDQVIVNPAAPEESLLYTKLVDPPCGDPMPLGSRPGDLPQNEVACVLEWIRGASDAPPATDGGDTPPAADGGP